MVLSLRSESGERSKVVSVNKHFCCSKYSMIVGKESVITRMSQYSTEQNGAGPSEVVVRLGVEMSWSLSGRCSRRHLSSHLG
jgi:hypothetical protein